MKMTITELIRQLQKDVDEGVYQPDDVVFFDIWTYDDVAVELENDHDVVRARRVWVNVAAELSSYDEYPDRETIRDIIHEHIEKDGEGK